MAFKIYRFCQSSFFSLTASKVVKRELDIAGTAIEMYLSLFQSIKLRIELLNVHFNVGFKLLLENVGSLILSLETIFYDSLFRISRLLLRSHCRNYGEHKGLAVLNSELSKLSP